MTVSAITGTEKKKKKKKPERIMKLLNKQADNKRISINLRGKKPLNLK